jgi:hypothetical protein
VLSEPESGARKDQEIEMKSLVEWKVILLNDFDMLALLDGYDEASRERQALKEQEIGQHCCEAGESLTDAELLLLKRRLGLTDRQWRAYKSKVWPTPA